ncbi:MAG: 16S rRNA (guanine(527)-N(7))-methyltransferase RsmG [Maricaulaceae bacterium]|jgi:16S rRNA (guanine527-N7)-methyltransferase
MTIAPMDIDSFIEATGVSRETASGFEVWRSLLEKWGARINLVGASTLDDFWRRHAYDSAQVYDLVSLSVRQSDAPRRWADIGSGAGFPGLAVALRMKDAGEAGEVHLIEPSAKRAAFLREAVRATGAPAVVHEVKVEDLPPRVTGEGFDVVTARACAPLTRLLGYVQSLWKDNTVGVFLKGREAEAELTAASKSWRFQSELQPSRSDPNGRVVLIKRLEHVDTRSA